jgi:light-regulated signal transduction histidine kinase (bacteriophytochrome)
MAYRVDTVTAGETLPDIAGATILAEALQSFTRLVVTGAYDRVMVRDERAGMVVAEWRRQGLDAPAATPASLH